ncbi:MAG: hypothetical protein SFW67_23605 [Myxococcaceae bacterium]|nr:hypothetical protein [Myxococcaceae bacterium]
MLVFDTASIAHAIDKPNWKRKEPPLRQAQPEALERRWFLVLVLVSGVEGERGAVRPIDEP